MLAFAALRRRLPFAEAIQWTLERGGDTDTNAAIVGAMIGALWGASGIPASMCCPVLAFDPTTGTSFAGKGGHAQVGRRRPAVYAPSSLSHLTAKLIIAHGGDRLIHAEQIIDIAN